MDAIRRAKIRVCVPLLQQLCREIRDIHEEEDLLYLDRTRASQASAEGRASGDAAFHLMKAKTGLEEVIDALENAAAAGTGSQ